jgi:integrase/recombinase XerD
MSEIIASTSTAIGPVELPTIDDILAGQIANSTRDMYRRDIAAYVKFARQEGLAEDNSKTLDAWRDWLVDGYTKRDGSQLSPNSINRMLSPLRRLYKEASRLDMVDESIAAKFRAVPGVKKKALKERLKIHSRTRISPEDMRRLCESPDTTTLVGLRDRALLATLASSGVRASELASLTHEQIVKKDGGYQLSVRGKTDVDYRDAALSPEAYNLIQAWLQARACQSVYVFTAFAGRGDRPLDTPISESGLWKCFVKYAKKCGIAHIKPHDARRFVGTQLAKEDIRKAQIALGHRDISTTAKHYVLDELPVGLTDHLY